MGTATGFLEFERRYEASEAPLARVKHYKEFVATLSADEVKIQGIRCMDCGIPFCSSGCPVHNVIPDFNDLVSRQDWRRASAVLHSTNNFPEFTGRICPAPCEAACTLGINRDPVGIKSIERAIIDRAWVENWIAPQPSGRKTGKRVAIIGSGPAGLAAAQQLARAGHAVTVFEKNDRVGGLLRYGIPDFKLEKWQIDRRMRQMEAEGVLFRTSVFIGAGAPLEVIGDAVQETITPALLQEAFDAIVMAGGAETPRDLPAPGRELAGIHFAMEFLPQQNRVNAGDQLVNQLRATGKHVVVIGGGDTGSDCVGTSNRHGAERVMQFELLPRPPEQENKLLVWPFWPLKLRTSSSHEEGCERDWAVVTKRFEGSNGKVEKLIAARLEQQDGALREVPGSEFEIAADLVLLAMGFTQPNGPMLDAFGITKDLRGNALAAVEGARAYCTSVDNIFAAGDMRRGQSLVVWAIREGRQCARAVDIYLMGHSELPR